MISLHDTAASLQTAGLKLTSHGVPVQGPGTRPNLTVDQVLPTQGGATITIHGNGFLNGSSVTINIQNTRRGDATTVFAGSDNSGVLFVGSQAVSGERGDSLIFSATDGRKDLADLTGLLWSNPANANIP